MMQNYSIEELIAKYLAQSISPDELKQLEQLLAEERNMALFRKSARAWSNSLTATPTKSSSVAWEQFVSRRSNAAIKPQRSLGRTLQFAIPIAASIVVAIVSWFVLQRVTTTLPTQGNEVVQTVEPVLQEVVLKLADGTEKSISEQSDLSMETEDGTKVEQQASDLLVYKSNAVSRFISKTQYNEVLVPMGKRFSLRLADGTKVWLNSGSWLRYPTQFNKSVRNVSLKGEAFFEVAKDPIHPFVVNANGLNVRVLGTAFNVSAYPDTSNIVTTLVEGAVCLYRKEYNKRTAVELTPNQQAVFDASKVALAIQRVEVDEFTAWKDGLFVFRSQSFKQLKRRLEYWYGVSIVNMVPELEQECFSGTFENESIQEVMDLFGYTYSFNWKIEGTVVTIEPKPTKHIKLKTLLPMI